MTTVNLLSPSGPFAFTGAQTDQLENLAMNAVNNGLSLFTKRNYVGDIKKFRPDDPNGHYGLGQLHAKQERLDKATEEFQAIIDIHRDFWDACVEQGYAHMDSGDTESAEKIAIHLTDQDASQAATLSTGIAQTKAPTMPLALGGGSFVPTLSPSTPMSFLGLYTPEQTQTLTMDRVSVEDIALFTNTVLGEGYNHGLPVPDAEVTLHQHLLAIYYDSSSFTATVYFSVSQNSDLTATIDPSHIRCAFSGKGNQGISIDPKTDSHAGFSGFP